MTEEEKLKSYMEVATQMHYAHYQTAAKVIEDLIATVKQKNTEVRRSETEALSLRMSLAAEKNGNSFLVTAVENTNKRHTEELRAKEAEIVKLGNEIAHYKRRNEINEEGYSYSARMLIEKDKEIEELKTSLLACFRKEDQQPKSISQTIAEIEIARLVAEIEHFKADRKDEVIHLWDVINELKKSAEQAHTENNTRRDVIVEKDKEFARLHAVIARLHKELQEMNQPITSMTWTFANGSTATFGSKP